MDSALVNIMSLLFMPASHVTASKNSNCHAMLNAIQLGMTIPDLQICRKEQQCGLRNIGDWGEGLNHVGEKLALVSRLFSSSPPKLFPQPKKGAQK